MCFKTNVWDLCLAFKNELRQPPVRAILPIYGLDFNLPSQKKLPLPGVAARMSVARRTVQLNVVSQVICFE